MERSSITVHRRWGLFCALAIVFGGTPAHAHLVTTGLGPFYDGIGHCALSPEMWLPAVALAIAAGLRGSVAGRQVLCAMPLAWIGGVLLAPASVPAFPFAALICLVTGILAAADLPIPAKVHAVIAGATGLLLGLLEGFAIRVAGGPALQAMAGAACVAVIVACVAGQFCDVQVKWKRILARVMGSWIAAIGLLLIGWAFRAQGKIAG